METAKDSGKRILLILLKSFIVHTATILSKELKMSRWGVWKILKKLEEDKLILLNQIGEGKTSTYGIKLNWDNIMTEKTLVLYLTQDALRYKRWRYDFEILEKKVEFLILYGSILYSLKEANDIDILGIAKKNKIRGINDLIFEIQKIQNKKIHSINLTNEELKQELKRKNKAFVDAIERGIVLFGQEKFVNFMRKIHEN